jgi:hypothetical protein
VAGPFLGRWWKETHVHHLLAYIDAGSGSMVLQVVIASIVAGPFFLRNQLRSAVRELRSRVGRHTDPADESAAR